MKALMGQPTGTTLRKFKNLRELRQSCQHKWDGAIVTRHTYLSSRFMLHPTCSKCGMSKLYWEHTRRPCDGGTSS